MSKDTHHFWEKHSEHHILEKALTSVVVAGTLFMGAGPADAAFSPNDHTIVTALAADIQTGTTTDALNLRQGAGTSFKVVKILPKGQKVEILKKDGKWLNVKAGTAAGWVHSDYVKISTTASTATPAAAKKEPGTTTQSLNLRKGAGTTYSVIKVLPKGTSVEILATNGKWLQVKAAGSTGWVHSDYIKKGPAAPVAAPPKTPAAPAAAKSGQTTEALNLRQGAGTTFKVLKVLPKGTKVEILSQSGKWLQVNAAGSKGWVSSDYIKSTTSTSPAAPSQQKTGYATDSLNLRKGAGTSYSVLKVLPKGTSLAILSESGSWLKVKAGTLEGYVHKDYVSSSKPAASSTAASTYKNVISTAKSYNYATSKERAANVELAASKINGTILKPGESYSFTKLVGPVTAAKGYKTAAVFSGGQVSSGIGGGICQVASTIYYAQLRAGIVSTERHNHSRQVPYVPLGLDATMWEGSKDHRFKNTFNVPIQIVAKASNGTLTIEFRSEKDVLGTTEYEPRTVKVSSTGNKETWDTYLRTYKNGKMTDEKYLHRSTYIMY